MIGPGLVEPRAGAARSPSRWPGRCGFALLAVWALACAGSPPPPDSFHRLFVQAPSARATPLLAGVVEVDRFQASDVLLGRPLAVSDADGRVLRHARYDYWADAPPILLQQALIGYLRAGGLAERVVTPEQRDDPRWIVSGRIQRFDWVRGGGSAGTLVIDLALRGRDDGSPRIQASYRATQEARSDDASAVADALEVAAGEVFGSFVSDVEAALAAPR